MKIIFTCLGLLLVAGCGESNVTPARPHGVYPALNESPPPPLLPASRFPNESATAASKVTGVEMHDAGFTAQTLRKDAQLQSLREYAARSGTNDPFALTEKEIEDLSKIDDLGIL